MKTISLQRKSFSEQITQNILHKIIRDRNLDHLDYLKCKIGLETFLVNLSKLTVVYGLAIVAGIFFETFIFHMSYMFIRTHAYGVHCKSSLQCTMISCLILLGVPSLLFVFQLPKIDYIFIYGANYMILYTYAPAATRKNGIYYLKEADKKVLRKKAMKANNIIFLMSLIIPSVFIGNLVIVASLTAAIMTTPLAYRILQSERID